MRSYHHIASRLYCCPLLMEPSRAQVVLGALTSHFGDISLEYQGAKISSEALKMKASGFTEVGERRSFEILNGGIAYIPITGTLVHKSGYLDPVSGMTGYDGIEVKLRDAMADPSVRGILIDIDSGGGEVSGCFDLCDYIQQIRQEKPIWAVANEQACSAAYAIGASAGYLWTSRTGIVGSIGVLMIHTDVSKALSSKGFQVTMIHAGSHKVDGNPYEPLPDEVRADVQVELEATRKIFIDTVAAGRGLSPEVILATEAKTFRGDKALGGGLIDGVASFSEVLRDFVFSLEEESS
ncbi:S49 family peptidase [Kiloniella laminariae]|uniref:S49 family peptidase n=1 Tax=Kiloniella laminariae TaxID=454162 RepID=UPI00039D868D|nr:S49 family peptidase [Kiloniella laminariae]